MTVAEDMVIDNLLKEAKLNLNDVNTILGNMLEKSPIDQKNIIIQLAEKSGYNRTELQNQLRHIREKQRTQTPKEAESEEIFLIPICDSKGIVKSYKVDIDCIADFLIGEFELQTIYGNKNEKIYVYKNGIWEQSGRGLLVAEIEKLLSIHAKNNIVREIVDKVKRKTVIERDSFDKLPNFKLCLENGVLDLKDVNDIKLLKHSKKYNFKTKMEISYDKTIKCPKFMDFINNTFYESDIPQVQEWFGLHLILPYLFKKAVIVQGPKDTGKTAFINILSTFNGKKNVAGLSLQNITKASSFHLLSLKDSRANIYDDLSAGDLQDGGGFKMAVGDGEIAGEEKFGDWFRFKNTAKMTFSCNKIPSTKEINDDAYYDRWLVWLLDKNIPKKKQDKKLVRKLTTKKELTGILNWAIEGYKRLITNNRFTNEKKPKEIKQIMMSNSNPLAKFVADCLEYGKGMKITKNSFYDSYCEWCEQKKLSPATKEHIGRKLPSFASYVRAGSDGSKRYWNNVKLKDTLTDITLLNIPWELYKSKREEYKGINITDIVNSKPSYPSSTPTKTRSKQSLLRDIPKRCHSCGSHEVFSNQTDEAGKSSYLCEKCDKDNFRIVKETKK